MWKYLLHLWAVPPTTITLVCPPPAAGQPADPQGFYDYATVAVAYDRVALVSLIIVVLGVVACYQATQASLGPRFVKRWWTALGSSALLVLVSTWLLLITAPTRAMAESCSTNPSTFPIELPASLVLERAIAGLVWTALAFVILSLLLTALLGRIAGAKNGFFHNRGCPWPRFTS